MRRQLRVGDVAVAPLPGGGFGACQVSGFDGGSVVVHALDWSSPEPPGLDDLRGVGPAILRSHRFREEIAQTSVAPRYHPLPPEFTWIGNLPVPPGVPSEVNSISGWEWPLIAVVLERDWADLPEEVRAARRLSRGADPVTVDLGAGPQTATTALASLDLRSWPADRPMDWSVLDRLPRCTEISWSGPDRGLVATLVRHPQISSLNWFDAPDTVDLSHTRVASSRISGAALRDLHLPPRARNLTIDGAAAPGGSPARTVHALDDGRWLHLSIHSATTATVAPAGLSQVRSVSLSGAGALSGGTVTAFPAAHTLTLRWTSPPGRLDDPAALAALPHLRLLEMFDAYSLDAETFPDLPLDDLLIHGLRGSTARTLRTRFRKSPVTLSLMGAKSDRWLAANLDNPFRDWADDHPAAGAAACKAYAKALKALTELPTPTPATASNPTPPPEPAAAAEPPSGSNPAAELVPARQASSTAAPSPKPVPATETSFTTEPPPLPKPVTTTDESSTTEPSPFSKPVTTADESSTTEPPPFSKSVAAAETSSAAGKSSAAERSPLPGSVAATVTSSAARPSSDVRSADGSDPGPAAGSAVTTLPAPSVEVLLRELVERLNAIDQKFGIIDTIRREEAGDAFMALAARAGIPAPLADEWFDTWRDF